MRTHSRVTQVLVVTSSVVLAGLYVGCQGQKYSANNSQEIDDAMRPKPGPKKQMFGSGKFKPPFQEGEHPYGSELDFVEHSQVEKKDNEKAQALSNGMVNDAAITIKPRTALLPSSKLGVHPITVPEPVEPLSPDQALRAEIQAMKKEIEALRKEKAATQPKPDSEREFMLGDKSPGPYPIRVPQKGGEK